MFLDFPANRGMPCRAHGDKSRCVEGPLGLYGRSLAQNESDIKAHAIELDANFT